MSSDERFRLRWLPIFTGKAMVTLRAPPRSPQTNARAPNVDAGEGPRQRADPRRQHYFSEPLSELRPPVCQIGGRGSFHASSRFPRDARRGPSDAPSRGRRRRHHCDLWLSLSPSLCTAFLLLCSRRWRYWSIGLIG
jgi:hypothetical protein